MLLIALLLLPSYHALAQPTGGDISSADRSAGLAEDQIRERTAREMEKEPKGLPKPEEEEEVVEPKGPAIFINKIILTGTESFPPESFQDLVQKYENRDVTRPELDALARAIQREYLRRGVIAACFIPPQDVKEGVITMRVVEAKMGSLEIQKAPFYTNQMVENYWSTKPGEPLRYDTISRDLQIMNVNPDREVRSILRAGEKPGTTDVRLEQKTEFPFHVTATYDREGVPETGRDRRGFGIRHNNFLFVDDMLIAGYIYGSSFDNKYFYHRVPVTNFGTTVMYGYSYSKSAPKKDQYPLGLSSQSRNSTLFVYQDLYLKDKYIGDMYGGVDLKDKTTKYIQGTINRDKFAILRFGTKLKTDKLGGVSYFMPEISQGINGLGARRKNPYSSRTQMVPYLDGLGPDTQHTDDGVENTFTIFKMGFRHRRPMPLNTQLNLNFQSQTAFEALASQEEMFLGGIDTVRGYPPGEFIADNAYQVNVELLFPAFFLPEWLKVPCGERPIKDEVTGLIFFDYAHGERMDVKDPPPGFLPERRDIDMSSIGAGLRLRLANQAILRLEWGFQLGPDRSITEVSDSRFHISLNFQDSLPREIRRLREVTDKERIHREALGIVNAELNRSGSRLGEMIRGLLAGAEEAYRDGNLELSKEYYQQVLYTGTTVIKQAEGYVQALYEKQKELESLRKEARASQKKGDLAAADELWQEILDKSAVEPLQLTF